MISVIDVFPQLKELGPQHQDTIKKLFTRRQVKKFETLLRHDQVETRVTFIEAGVFKHATIAGDEEACVGLFRPGHMVSNHFSWLYGSPSPFKIQSLTPGYIWELTDESFERLSTNPGLQNELRRLLAEQMYTQHQHEYVQMAMRQHTTEKYDYLLRHEGYILKHTPLTHLADYLGVTQPTLSRIRRQIMEKEWNSKTTPGK